MTDNGNTLHVARDKWETKRWDNFPKKLAVMEKPQKSVINKPLDDCHNGS